MSLTAGERLGRYEILAPLGAGGMGEVYKARDTRLDRIVALKVSRAEFSERFEREARAVAALNHPHICQLYDIGPNYLVMEYVEGAPLRGPLPAEEAIRLSVQIASALEEAHSRGIMHRDLKPGNILLNAKGAAKLLDFGIAKLLDSRSADVCSTLTMGLTQAGAVVGTVAYMSPEQAQGEPMDARSEIFSFGLVLYEVLSGKRAFSGDTHFAIMSAIVRDEPAPFQAPPALERIIKRCLAKPVRERYQTMTELRAALEQAKQAESSPRLQPSIPQPSIAVLPFANMSADKENEYFSDGLAEEIINALAHISGLKVIARTSAFAFRGQHTDVRQIAETLGVANILEGSVRRAGSRVRVTAQLIAATDGSHLWSERFDREMADVFAIQDEISQAIAGALQLKLAVAPRTYTPNLAAYEAYLKGRHHWAKLTPESFAKSRECYEQAVALDAQFALARVALAEHFFALFANCLMPRREALSRVRAGALEALEIDPTLAEAHALLGMSAAFDYDWVQAARHFQLAKAREPIPPYVRFAYGEYLMILGRFREAGEEFEGVLRDDPRHLLCRSHLADCLHATGRVEDAFRQLGQILEVDDSFGVAHFYMTVFLAMQGSVSAALASAEKVYSMRQWDSTAVGLLAGMAARAGDRPRAEKLLATLGPSESPGAPAARGLFHLVQMETDLAAEWTGKAIDQGDSRAAILLHRLRSSSRWPALAKMVNLPET